MISTSKNLLARRESECDFDKYKIGNLPTATAQDARHWYRTFDSALVRFRALDYLFSSRLMEPYKRKSISHFDWSYLLLGKQKISSEIGRSFYTFPAFFLVFLDGYVILPADRDRIL